MKEKLSTLNNSMSFWLTEQTKCWGYPKVSTGGISGTVADPKQIFTAALKANAFGIILSHNHPSGNFKTSRQDEELTRKFKEAGYFLDIKPFFYTTFNFLNNGCS